MADDTNKQAISSGNIEKKDNQLTNEGIDIYVEVPDGSVHVIETKFPGGPIIAASISSRSIPGDPYLLHFDQGVSGTQDIGNSVLLRFQILEEPLTAQSLSTIIAAITDLYTRCWLIHQKRFSDLMDYTQTRDPRFVREANLRVGAMSHNSPTLIDFIIGSGGIAGAASLVVALKIGIDAIAQTPLRFQATKLKNDKEALEQKIREQQAQQEQTIATQKAEIEDKAEQQELQFAAQKAQLELEKQQLELDIQRFELQKNRVFVVLETAKIMVNELQPDIAAGEKEMIIHSLVPPLLQLAATDAIVTVTQPAQLTDENKGTSEEK